MTPEKLKIPFLYDYVFANMVLPNALIPEFGIVSYLHTIYSNKIRSTNFFEEEYGFNDQSLAGLIFGNELGLHPNSIGFSNIFSDCYKHYLECHEDSVFYGKKKFNKYIYLIRIPPFINDFAGKSLEGRKINGEYFWKHMSAEALADARQGKAIIFLDYGQENYMEKETYDAIHEALKYSFIPKEQIILGINSFNAQEIYEAWYTPEERRLEVRNWPYVIANTSYHYNVHREQMVSDLEFAQSRDKIRKHHFLFKVRRPRDHRIALLFKMASDGLLEKADWSCLTPEGYTDFRVHYFATKFQFDLNADAIKNLCAQLPHTLESESGNHYTDVRTCTDKHSQSYQDSYFYVCTETFVHGDHKSLTEKVFKPIVNFQPFLLAAYPGALKVLKNLGFKTFSPFIDESYDDETDEVKRLQLIYSEIARLSSMSLKELHAWYWNMEETLIHNRRHFLSIWKNDLQGQKLIKYLHHRVSS